MTIEQSHAEGWFKSRRLADGITLIWEAEIKPFWRCNIWHVRGRDRDMLVDSGFGIVSLLHSIPALSERPIAAVGSHSHCDHIGGHYEFADREIHADEADILANPTRFNTVIEPYVVDDMFEGAPPRGFDAASFTIRPAPATRTLVEGDVVDLGDRAFEVLHIPGHSPGSIALYERSTGIMFSGDVVHNGEYGIGNLVLYHSIEDHYVASAERLLSVPVETVHAGHFDSFGRTRYQAIIKDYIRRKRPAGCPIEAARDAAARGTAKQ
jgi:glyoxylase-like metal-dependent hydrolase (beta-lactamase superfamily II)